jgi:hypothetical protein
MSFSKNDAVKSFLVVALLSFGFLAAPIHAQDINLQSGLTAQDDFKKTVRDLGTAFSYIPADPAEAHGIIGFNLGFSATAVQLPDQNAYMQNTFQNSNAPGTLLLPKIQFEKGLPFVEVGGFVAGDPDGNARLFGGQVKYMLMEGNLAFPAVALRGHGTQLTGVDDLDLSTYGADLSVSKGFEVPLLAGITPFAGYSMFQVNGSENDPNFSVNDVSTTESRMFAGARFSLLFFNLVAEADIGDEVKMYTLRTNIGF